MKSEIKSLIKIFAAGCLWGTIGVFVKLMEVNGSTASYTSFLRLFFGFIIMTALTLLFEGVKAFHISKRVLASCILLGIVCQGLFNLLYSSSITKNGISLASVLLYTAPVFTGITSVLLFKERLTKRKWVALFINVIGCAFTATGGNFTDTSIVLYHVLIGVGAGFTYAMVAVFGRIAMREKASPYVVAAYNLLFGSIFIALTRHPWSDVAVPLDPRILVIGILFGLIPTALAYTFYFSGLANITQISKAPVIASVELIVATLLGMVLFHETLTSGNVVGIAFVLCSIMLFSN